MAAVIGLVGYAGSAAMIGWIQHLLLWLVVRMQTLHSTALKGDADPMLLGEEIDTSPLGSGEPGHRGYFWLLPVVNKVSATTTLLGQVKWFCTQEVPLLDISNNGIFYYTEEVSEDFLKLALRKAV